MVHFKTETLSLILALLNISSNDGELTYPEADCCRRGVVDGESKTISSFNIKYEVFFDNLAYKNNKK